MNPEQWLSLKWNGGSTMSDRWLNQSKIIHKDLRKTIEEHHASDEKKDQIISNLQAESKR